MIRSELHTISVVCTPLDAAHPWCVAYLVWQAHFFFYSVDLRQIGVVLFAIDLNCDTFEEVCDTFEGVCALKAAV